MSGSDSQVRLLLRYSPPDFFGEPLRETIDGFDIQIGDGLASAATDATSYDADPAGTRAEFAGGVERLFLGGQLAHRQPFELGIPGVERPGPDGCPQFHNFVEIRATLPSLDVSMVIATSDGQKIVVDSKNERTERQARLARRLARHAARDATAEGIARSYAAAVKDPQDELVHLYEIRDALAKRFGNAAGALAALHLSEKDWKALGRLSSSLPLKQGRHRGASAGQLREATPEELQRARSIARSMTDAYLTYLG